MAVKEELTSPIVNTPPSVVPVVSERPNSNVMKVCNDGSDVKIYEIKISVGFS